jgi:hypothetical protein
MKKVALTIVFLCSVLLPQFLHAQEVFRAEVTKVVSEEKTPVELGIGSGFVQMLEASVIFTKYYYLQILQKHPKSLALSHFLLPSTSQT